MGDKTAQTNRDRIVLEYLSGGVTYRQLEAKWGVDHATIQRWVLLHKGIPRNRKDGHPTKKSTNKPTPQVPPPPPVVDEEKVQLEKQLLQAQRKILLLQEVITIAQAEQGLILPKKFTTKPLKLSGNEKK